MKIGNRFLEIPLIQGGMGVAVSLGRLAGSVAKCGAMGVISTADTGFREPEFWKNKASYNEANERSLLEEIRKAKEIAGGKGLIAVNAMVATADYVSMVKTAVKGGIDCIISGAGLPTQLPEYVKGSDVLIAPIVSSFKAAKTLCKLWDKRYEVCPDFVVVEGPEAGGHLGFDKEELLAGTAEKLESIVVSVKEAIQPFAEKYKRHIPIFAAGGIFTSDDVKRIMDVGADGVQVATRFLTTHECDASDEFKQMYIDAKEEDIQIVQSPVGMPGRALMTPLMEKLKESRIPPKKCVNCLTPCNPGTTPYCITDALIKAWYGDKENGLFFAGSKAFRLEKIMHAKDVIDELMSEVRDRI